MSRSYVEARETEGVSLLRDLLADEPDRFWYYFGGFAREFRDRGSLTDAEPAQINERLIAFAIYRARTLAN